MIELHHEKTSFLHKLKQNSILMKLLVEGPRSAVLAGGRRPRANTADRGPLTLTASNFLINVNFTNYSKNCL